MKKMRILLLLLTLGCIMCACSDKGNANEPSAAATDNIIRTSDALADSVTYVNLDDLYIPVSCIRGGKQLFNGNMRLYSIDVSKFLKEAPAAEELPKVSSPVSSGLCTLASNGTWEFFPDAIEHQTYTPSEQPKQSEWTEYFQERLSDISSDSPVILRESSTFSWNGTDASIVTASNVVWEEGQAAGQPSNIQPVVYTITALFLQGQKPIELFMKYSIISETLGSTFLPPANQDDYLQALTVIQNDPAGNIRIFPVYTNMNGELLLRDFAYFPRWLISDVDGDGHSELILNITASSSTMCYCKVYRFEQSAVKETLHISLN